MPEVRTRRFCGMEMPKVRNATGSRREPLSAPVLPRINSLGFRRRAMIASNRDDCQWVGIVSVPRDDLGLLKDYGAKVCQSIRDPE